MVVPSLFLCYTVLIFKRFSHLKKFERWQEG
jgi:hypothetical protein